MVKKYTTEWHASGNMTTESLVTKHLPSHKILQYRTFACTLSTHNRYLWKIQLHMNTQLCEGILEFINDWNELFHPSISRHFVECSVSRTPHLKWIHFSHCGVENQYGGLPMILCGILPWSKFYMSASENYWLDLFILTCNSKYWLKTKKKLTWVPPQISVTLHFSKYYIVPCSSLCFKLH